MAASNARRRRKYRAGRAETTRTVEPVKTAFVDPADLEYLTAGSGKGRGGRASKTNPRALGTNPRALGTNPRALGMSPRQLRKFCPLLTEDEANEVFQGLVDDYERGQREQTEREQEEAQAQLGLSPQQIANRNPSGLCRCGCGGLTSKAQQSNRRDGHLKGEPLAYLRGHHLKHRQALGGESPGPAVSSLPLGSKPGGKPVLRLTDEERGDVADLYRRRHAAIRRHFKRSLDPNRTPDNEFPEDLLQATFVRVCETIRNRPHEANVDGWLMRIAKHIGIDYFKHAGRKKRGGPGSSLNSL